MMEMESKELLVAKKTAVKAGELLLRKFNEKKTSSSYKAEKDIVTDADIAAQELIFSELKKEFGKCDFLGEEGFDGNVPRAEKLWVVDPLDGTMNFEAGIPDFCVSIALVDSTKEKFSPKIGVVYNPILKEMFFAQNGGGAFLNNMAIAVSKRVLREGIVNISLSKQISNLPIILEGIRKLHSQTRRFRSFGSTPMQACFVACGRLAADINFSDTPWDSAAANLIVKEAGGVFYEMNGSEWKLASPTILVANNNENAQVIIKAFK